MADRYIGGELLAEVVRSDFVEGYHRGSVVVLDAAGEVRAVAGDATGVLFPRSSNKPMQAVGMLRAGLCLDDPADLAIVAASHFGEPFHIDRVRALLAGAGLSEDDLRCATGLPLDAAARDAVLAAGGGPTRITMNCSGKHTGMLLTCVANGWPTEGYPEPEHPVQVAVRAGVEDVGGEPAGAVGVDGCGAPVLAISLHALATGFLRLVSAPAGSPERRVADAMREYPEVCSGTTTDDARIMRAVPGLLAKGGAEGVLAVAVPGAGAVAIKIDDGARRPTVPVLVSALRRLDADTPDLVRLASEADGVVQYGGGHPVGTVRAIW